MACFCAGLWLWPPAPAQAGADGIHGVPLISSWTAWMGRLSCCRVGVQTSCAEICTRAAELALAAAPPRFTVAVVPVTATLIIVVRSGKSVTAGGVTLAGLCSQGVCGSL